MGPVNWEFASKACKEKWKIEGQVGCGNFTPLFRLGNQGQIGGKRTSRWLRAQSSARKATRRNSLAKRARVLQGGFFAFVSTQLTCL